MGWVDDKGAPVTDPMLLRQLGAPAEPAPAAAPAPAQGGRWVDDKGAPVTDPLVLKQLGAAAPAPVSPTLEPIDGGFTNQLVRAMTFGLSDKAGALGRATAGSLASAFGGGGRSFSETYHGELARLRGEGDQYAEAHPFLSPLATGLGYLSSAAPNAISGLVGRNALGQFTAASRVGNVALPRTMPQLVAQGATMGGLQGLGGTNDESIGQNIQAAGAGALGGGLTSGILGTVGPRVASSVTDALHSRLGHIMTAPGLLAAAAGAAYHPPSLPYVLGGAAGIGGAHLLTQVPPRAGAAMIPLAARAVGDIAPSVVSNTESLHP